MVMKGKNELLETYKKERQKCQTWTRVMGYYRNTDSFNVGKVSEFKERVFYKVKNTEY